MPRLKPKAGEPPTGDLLAKVKVILPTDLSDEARQPPSGSSSWPSSPTPEGRHRLAIMF